MMRFRRRAGWLEPLGKGLYALLGRRQTNRPAKIRALAAGDYYAGQPYFLSRALFLPAGVRALLPSLAFQNGNLGAPSSLRELAEAVRFLDPLNQVSVLEGSAYMGNTLLRDTDCMSMANSLEVRTPLLHHPLWEYGQGFVLKTTANPHWKEVAQAVTRPEAIALLQSPEIAQRVQFVGPLPRKETQRLYRDADLFVFPSWLESFGQPMAEAMAHGLPIVAADTPLNREICGESAVYFRVRDPGDLAEKVRNLWADEALRQNLIESGRARAANNFKWQDHAARLLAALAPA
jgi:hypothetical protein